MISIRRPARAWPASTISPDTTLAVNGQQQMSAQCTFSDRTVKDCTSLLAWSTDSPGVATVSPSGLVTGAGEGSARITGTYLGATATATITVRSFE